MPAPAPALPYWRLSSFYFWYYAALGAFTPYFARWLDALGLGATLISAVFALWYGTRMLAPPLWGEASTRSTHPLRWLRAGAVLTVLCFAGFLFTTQAWPILAVMLGFAFFCNAIMPQYEALTLNTLGARRGEYSRIRVWGSIGFIVVVAAYGFAIDRIGARWLPAMMLPLLVGIAVSTLLAPATPPHADDIPKAGLFAALRRVQVRRLLLIALLVQVGFGPYYVFYTLHLGAHGHSTGAIGILWGLGVVVEIGVFLLAPRVLARYGALVPMLACIGASCVRWAVIGTWPQSLPAMAAMQVLHGLSFALFHACTMQLIGEEFRGRSAGQGQGLLYGLGSGLGGVVGTLGAGVAWNLGAGLAAFAFGALACLVALPVALQLHGSQRSARPVAALEPMPDP
ncbi:MFS transporter [Chiayiivirga flava]|uniref:PPP family 3-phenylpropionic acid transporter n=1 Tax=Chiayiivirga flava TaxID=659595 RepID=A0A7W8D845_9GAMM|nr:MFS transporter [Chiayiivirga flava]MBB5208426.1 PPP family 3-phenylpropionic acid transporter [Chiayiivirga flava]